jgi:hypothetical protein
VGCWHLRPGLGSLNYVIGDSAVHRSAYALLLAALLTACGPRQAETGATPDQAVGASSPRAAVERFLGAVRAQDLQAMGVIWGTSRGPARDQMAQDVLEKRELIMQCYLLHDQSRVVRDNAASEDRRDFVVELTKGPLVRTTTFSAVKGPRDRWYIENVDLDPVKDLCRAQSSQ